MNGRRGVVGRMTPPEHREATRRNGRLRGIVIAVAFLLVVVLAVVLGLTESHPQSHPSAARTAPSVSSPSADPLAGGRRVCGQSILNSPYSYTGRAGPYSSGTAGLPTYGTP